MNTWVLPAVAAAFWAGILARVLAPSALRGGHAWIAGLVAFVAAGVLAVGTAPPQVAPGARTTPGPSAAQAGRAAPGRRPARGPPWAAAVAALLGFLLLGAGWGDLREQRIRESVLARVSPVSVRVQGALGSDPKPGPYGWTAELGVAEVRLLEPAGSLPAGTTLGPHERVWLESEGPLPSARRGDRLVVRGRVARPDADEFGTYLLHRGIAVLLEADEVRRVGPSPNPLVRAAQAVRAALLGQVQRRFGDREAGLLMGLALGDTSRLTAADEEHFRATGLGHLLAVSGENVALVLMPVLGLAVLLRLRAGPRFALGAATVLFFVVLTGAEPSMLRAGVMAGLALTATLLGRPRSSGTLLAAAALLLLVADPMLVYSVGFQLSVAATAGIVAMAGPVTRRLGFLPRPLAIAAATTLSAQAAVSPILLDQFHQVPWVTIPANLLAFPAVAPALLLGLAAAAAGLVVAPLAGPLAWAAGLAIRYLEWLADVLASAPLPSVTSGGGPVTLVVGLALVAVAAWWLRSGRPLPRRAVVAAAAAFPLFVWATALSAGPPSGLLVEFLDVGQGDAALVRTPDGATILIDGGPDPELVATKLAARGVKRLDLVVATHPHTDHFVGLPTVLARVPTGLVLETPCVLPETRAPPYQEFLEAVRSEGVAARRPWAGDVVRVGEVRLEVLSPARCLHGTNSDPNNDSLVLRLTYREDSVLFANEPEADAQRAMLDRGVNLRADVLNVPHHGADTSWPPFLHAVHERLAVISVGQPNPYGHPAPGLLQELRVTDPVIARTDRCGDVTVEFEPAGLRVTSEACPEQLLQSGRS